MDTRYGRVQWGKGNPRSRTSAGNWNEPKRWNRDAEKSGIRQRVFCASLADVFDSEVNIAWLADLFCLIRSTQNLDWLLLTKRPENIRPRLRLACEFLDKKYSTGYIESHETSSKRNPGLRGGQERRTGNRQSRKNLAGQETNKRPMDGRSENDAVRESAGGDSEQQRLSSSEGNARRQEVLRSGAPAGMVSLQREDCTRNDSEPQTRKKEGQSASGIGTRDIQRAETPCDSNAQSETSRREGREASQDTTEKFGRVGNETAEKDGAHGQEYSSGLQHESEGGGTDCNTPDMEAFAVANWLRDWLGGNPPENVWLGVSVENQKCADERIPTLIETDAAIKFLSIEPMLGEIDLSYWLTEPCLPNLQWVIVGGESGPRSRPMQESWVQAVRAECEVVGVPFFFKQWGGKLNKKGGHNAELNGKIWHELPSTQARIPRQVRHVVSTQDQRV